MDENQRHSELVKVKPLFPVKYPRALAGLWFTACGFVAGAFFGPILAQAGENSSSIGQGCLIAGIMGAIFAVIPAFLLGARVLDSSKTRSIWEAGHGGVRVVFAAHCVLGMLICLTAAASAIASGNLLGIGGAMLAFFGFLLFSSIIPGVVTYSTGWIGAALLYKITRLQKAPKGCAVHGYGEGRNAIAGE